MQSENTKNFLQNSTLSHRVSHSRITQIHPFPTKALEIAVIISRYSTASSSLLAVYGVIRATTFFLSVALSEVGQIDKRPRAMCRGCTRWGHHATGIRIL